MAGVSVAVGMAAGVVRVEASGAEVSVKEPPSARVLVVTVLPVPTAAVSKVPVPLQVTVLLMIRRVPGSALVAFAALFRFLLVAVIAGVSVAAVMFAVVVAVVAESA